MAPVVAGVSVCTVVMVGAAESVTTLTTGRFTLGFIVLVGLGVEDSADGKGSKGSSGVVSGPWVPTGFRGSRNVPLFG